MWINLILVFIIHVFTQRSTQWLHFVLEVASPKTFSLIILNLKSPAGKCFALAAACFIFYFFSIQAH